MAATGYLKVDSYPGAIKIQAILDRPIDVIATNKVTNSESEKNVKVIQLILSGGFWDQTKELGRGAHVILKGELWHQYTGHHHSRILLDVDHSR